MAKIDRINKVFDPNEAEPRNPSSMIIHLQEQR